MKEVKKVGADKRAWQIGSLGDGEREDWKMID
jgi:hypothetical protein